VIGDIGLDAKSGAAGRSISAIVLSPTMSLASASNSSTSTV